MHKPRVRGWSMTASRFQPHGSALWSEAVRLRSIQIAGGPHVGRMLFYMTSLRIATRAIAWQNLGATV